MRRLTSAERIDKINWMIEEWEGVLDYMKANDYPIDKIQRLDFLIEEALGSTQEQPNYRFGVKQPSFDR